jgi:hypothetical protein
VVYLNEVELYSSVRQEIIKNHALMHWFTLVVVLILLVGVYVVENRRTILSVFLPLLSLAWAAAVLRFDFFIHRQIAYLRTLGYSMQQNGLRAPIWEIWKDSLIATPIIVPVADLILFLIVVLPTVYILVGPTQEYFRFKQWKGWKWYASIVVVLLLLLLSSLILVPKLARWGAS